MRATAAWCRRRVFRLAVATGSVIVVLDLGRRSTVVLGAGRSRRTCARVDDRVCGGRGGDGRPGRGGGWPLGGGGRGHRTGHRPGRSTSRRCSDVAPACAWREGPGWDGR